VDAFTDTLAADLLIGALTMIVLIPLGAWAVRAGRRKQIRNNTREDL
jgi:hypothetical protein